MTPIPPLIAELHRLFCSLTGQELRIGIGEYSRERCWFAFIQAGYTADDLMIVVKHLRQGISKGERRQGCLRFSNLIERLEHFEEELALAKAERRNSKPAPTPKDKAVQTLRPVVTESAASQNTAKPVGDLIEKLKQAAGMRT